MTSRLYQFFYRCHLAPGEKGLASGNHGRLSGKMINQRFNSENEPVRGSSRLKRGFMSCLVSLVIFFALASSIEAGGVVLVLSGGGTRGLAHIGVLKVLEENGVRIEGIVGTSIGSLVGGLYACGYSAGELQEMLEGIDLTSLLYDRQRGAVSPPGEEGSSSAQSLLRLEFNERGHLSGPLGGLDGERLLEKFQEWTSRSPVLDFNYLPIPYAAVATDLVTGEAVVLKRGNLASAIRASMAIPGLFTPWTIDGRLLVDGGLVSNSPVLIAKDLFPEIPVIVVDVTGRGKDREDIRTVVDVVDQMISIMTQRNVMDELKFADLVITPGVGGLPMLDVAGYDEIIEAGEQAARAALDEITRVAATGGTLPAREQGPPMMVSAVRVTGVGEVSAQDIREQYSWWIGNEASPEDIIEACADLRSRDDIRTADFSIECLADGSVAVVINVEKEPVWELVAGGYAADLNPYAALYLDLTRRDLFTEGDSLRSHFALSESWQFSSSYLAPVDQGYSHWEIFAKAGKRIISPLGEGRQEWEQYSLGALGHFRSGPFRVSLGYAGEIVRFAATENTFSGPVIMMSWDGLDDPIDPTGGFSASLEFWWREMDRLLGRMTFLGVAGLGENMRLFMRGGAMWGDVSRAYHAAYLGARDEIYSRASAPLAAENAAWAGIGLRKVFLKSWWGTINMDLFATAGQTYDSSWSPLGDVWEAGLALSLPGKIFDGKLLILYDDRDEWTFGFIIGRPLWENDPLP